MNLAIPVLLVVRSLARRAGGALKLPVPAPPVIGHLPDGRSEGSPKLRAVEDLRPLVCPILVGRDDLLALADRRLDEIGPGNGHLLLIAGEAGLGKTRLLSAIERRATAAGFRVVRAGTYPSDLQVPAALLIDLSRALQRDAVLAPLGTRLADRLADGASTDTDPGRRRRLLVLDVADLLAELAGDGRILIGLEDLHWSDDLTLEILEAFARRIGELAVMVVATYRSDELYPRAPTRQWRARLLAQRRGEEIRLRRLSPDETATMTAVIQGSMVPPARDVVEAIHSRTDGIPLHVEELLALLRGHEVASPDEVREVDVPETVEDAILARIGQRSASAATVARTGAVIGRSFDLDLLCAVTGQPIDGAARRARRPVRAAPRTVALAVRLPPRPDLRRDLRRHPRAGAAATARPHCRCGRGPGGHRNGRLPCPAFRTRRAP
jgi:hypothetical protein